MGSRHSFMTRTWKGGDAGGRTSVRSDAADRLGNLGNIMFSEAGVQLPHLNPSHVMMY